MERCSIMPIKALHRMMPIPQVRKNCEGLKSWHLYFLSVLFKIRWKKFKSFHRFEQALDRVFLHTYDTSMMFFSPVFCGFPAWLNLLLWSCRQYVLLVPSVVRSGAPQTACVQLHNLSEPLALSVVLEHGSVQNTLFEEPIVENDFFKCSEFKVFPLLKLLKRV